jgi:hypothetical protein
MGGQKKEYGNVSEGFAPKKMITGEKDLLKKLKRGERLSYFNNEIYRHERNGMTKKVAQRGNAARYLIIRGEISKESGGYLKLINNL